MQRILFSIVTLTKLKLFNIICRKDILFEKELVNSFFNFTLFPVCNQRNKHSAATFY